MTRRVVILSELIAPYRIPVFNALARRPEIELHVIFLARTDRSMRQWRIYEEEICFSYEVLPSWRKRISKYNLLLNRGLRRSLRGSKPEVIICGGYNYISSWQALRWAKRHRIPFLLWSESTNNDQRGMHALIELLKRMFVRNCDGFVVPGKSAREYLLEFGVSPEEVFVAPNAVDTALFSRLLKLEPVPRNGLRAQLALPDRYFLFVGRLVREKGVRDLLDAYALLPPELREQLGLVFAGDGPLRLQLESLAREICPGTVQFAGFVQRDELAAYYTLAECFVFPTHTDTWGLVINEAMACDLPIICTSVAGCATDLVKTNGRVVPPKDITQLRNAMQEIARDVSLRHRMATESHRAVQGFSPEICAAAIAQASSGVDTYGQ
jgi:glycosyltransferase involved in cell wall biosynthesis